MKVKYLARGMEKFFKKDKEYQPFTRNGDVYVTDEQGTDWFLNYNGSGYSIYCGVVSEKTFAEFV